MRMDESAPEVGTKDKLVNFSARALLSLALMLPYRLRVPLVGRITAFAVAPLAGWRKRIRDNLDHVMPELGHYDRERIVNAVSNNVGRTLIEIYSGESFVARTMDSPLTGPGVGALEAARAAKTPMVLVTAHLGNYDAVRGKLSRTGYPMGALYRPMSNTLFNAHYLKAISTIAEPVLPRMDAALGDWCGTSKRAESSGSSRMLAPGVHRCWRFLASRPTRRSLPRSGRSNTMRS